MVFIWRAARNLGCIVADAAPARGDGLRLWVVVERDGAEVKTREVQHLPPSLMNGSQQENISTHNHQLNANQEPPRPKSVPFPWRQPAKEKATTRKRAAATSVKSQERGNSLFFQTTWMETKGIIFL